LDPHIPFDVVNEASEIWKDVVLLEYPANFLGQWVFHFFYLEKEDVAGTPGNECSIIYQEHLSKIHFSHPMEAVVLTVVSIYYECLPLPVKRVDFMLFRVVEAFVSKVLLCASQFLLDNISNN
jgi:hypothetical protein